MENETRTQLREPSGYTDCTPPIVSVQRRLQSPFRALFRAPFRHFEVVSIGHAGIVGEIEGQLLLAFSTISKGFLEGHLAFSF